MVIPIRIKKSNWIYKTVSNQKRWVKFYQKQGTYSKYWCKWQCDVYVSMVLTAMILLEEVPKTFHYTLRIHTRLWNFFQQQKLLWAPLAHKHHTAICINILSRFPVSDKIWVTFYDWSHHFIFDSTFTLKFINNFRFNLTQFYDLIWLQLYPFYSPFLIWLSFSDSIWLIIYHPIKLSYLILFDTNCTHLNHHFRFESEIISKF